MDKIPDHITHYYQAGSVMLKNICSHPDKVAVIDRSIKALSVRRQLPTLNR